jgi:hypothetical protein
VKAKQTKPERKENSHESARHCDNYFRSIGVSELCHWPNNFSTPVPNRDAGVEEQLTGLVSDAICKGMHFRKALTPFSCTLKCVHDGADYSLVVGDKVYVLEGHRAELDKFAGGRATIRGQVNGNRIAVDSVTKAEKKAEAANRTAA